MFPPTPRGKRIKGTFFVEEENERGFPRKARRIKMVKEENTEEHQEGI